MLILLLNAILGNILICRQTEDGYLNVVLANRLTSKRFCRLCHIILQRSFLLDENKMQQNDNLFELIRDHLQAQARNGERIDTETELAKRFGVTRYRIRKELDVLTQMGILVRTPKRGTTVREVGANSLRNQIQMRFDVANFDIQEFIEARALVECSLMPLITRRITPALASRLEGTLNKIEEHANEPLVADRFDREFHLLLLEGCGNRVLQVFSGVLVTYFEKTSHRVAKMDPSFFIEVARQEREILHAIRMGEAQKAADLLRSHLMEQSQLLPL